jgi:polar amino acid transport system permease protein
MVEEQPEGSRASKLLGGGSSGAAYVVIAIVSTLVVWGGIALIIVNSPGWPTVKKFFFDGEYFREDFVPFLHAFTLNIKIFCVAEACILVFALALAIVRSLPGPVFFPLRWMAIIYTDVMRGVPTIIVIVLLGEGVPGLQLSGVPIDPVFWGTVALILVYSAYVAEVYRAGIESIHPSQEAAARSLGLSRFQTLRHVIVPQAVRRVVPPLLNDFIGLTKDTALVAVVGVVEVFQSSNIAVQANFNYTPLVVTSCIFLIFTIPMCRVADWAVDRERRRSQMSRAA